MPEISIVIPVYNEAGLISNRLQSLRQLLGGKAELIVVDGGSSDSTIELAEAYADQVVSSLEKGRAAQMNAGATLARSKTLLFLHIDTLLPSNIPEQIENIARAHWGFFQVQLDGDNWPFRMIEYMINLRSRVSSVATGDQCLFIRRELFEKVGGYQPIALMEDVAISKTLRKLHRPHVIDDPVVTSSRRWQTNGTWRTIVLMWELRLLYFLGVNPQKLATKYR